MKKYVFKLYSPLYPVLFEREKVRIAAHLGKDALIEHVGSTAVPNLGGKGIIDIAIAVPQKEIEEIAKKLQELGYEYRPNFSTPDRQYFVAFLPDPEERQRRYHIHLMTPQSGEWKEFIGFRDYLRHHPEAVEEYAQIKQRAAEDANQEGEKYRKLKEPFIQKIKSFLRLS